MFLGHEALSQLQSQRCIEVLMHSGQAQHHIMTVEVVGRQAWYNMQLSLGDEKCKQKETLL